MTQKKIDEISNLLLEYSAGNYTYQGSISEDVDEFDMIISGINMLGEELLSTNIDKDYFLSIFNAVTDLVLIVDSKGKISDFNNSVLDTLAIKEGDLKSMNFDQLFFESGVFKGIKSALSGDIKSVLLEKDIKKTDHSKIIGQLTCSKIMDRFDEFKGYLVSIKDVTLQKEHETYTLKAIFSAQQSEQKRMADDLHDSLGQELSMTKLMISNLKRLTSDNPKALELIQTCTDILDSSIKHFREICFNLMLGVLTRGGINMAISELSRKLEVQDKFKVTFTPNPQIERIDADLEIVIYRIIQEFINNMIKHSSATELLIELTIHQPENAVSVLLKENGQGFDLKKLDKIGENRGYQNLKTKVKAFKGELLLNSSPGKGTSTFVKFPILPYHDEN